MRKARGLFGIILLTLVLLTQPVSAANNLTWDNNYGRTRQTVDNMGQFYNASPIAVSIGDALGTWVYSMSTPIVYQNVLYQYAYNTDTNYAYLVAVDISKTNPQTAADFPVLWATNFKAEAGESIDGSPGPSISPDGQYMSIAVGKYLYTWPMSYGGYPNTPDSNGKMKGLARYEISGNSNQNTNLIAMSPAITRASYAWQGTDINTFDSVTFNAPLTIAGSWNGGFSAAPLYIPDNIDPSSILYVRSKTTDVDPSWTGEIFTSSPAIQSDGDGDILFGVDGGYPVLFVFHPSSMSLGYIGGGTIQYGIASAPVVDPQTGYIYVPDKMGNIYAFDGNGYYRNKSTSLYNGNLIISAIAIDNNYIYAVKAGHSEVHAIDKYTMSDQGSIFPSSSGYTDPSVVINTVNNTSIVAVNDASGKVYTSASSGLFVTSGTLSTSAQGYAPPPYVSVLMDAGPNQLIASWTNDAVANNETGALEFWVPQVNDITATVNPSKVQPNDTTTVYVDTTVDNTSGEAWAQLPDSSGTPVPESLATKMNYVSSSPGPGGKTLYRWQLQFRASSSPGDYTLPVKVRYTAPGNTASPLKASAAYSVLKPPGGVVQNSGATLTLQSYAWPENRNKTNAEFHSWPLSELKMQHPAGTTYMGDTVLSNLTVQTPALPDSSDRLVSSYLTSATITRPEGSPSGTQWTTNIVSELMELNGMTATLQFEQTWAGWQPGQYVADTPAWANNSPTLKTPDWQGNIMVDYVIHVVYQYPVESCSSIPDGKGGFIESCSTSWETAEMDVPGSTSAPLASWGTDFVIVPVTAGNSFS